MAQWVEVAVSHGKGEQAEADINIHVQVGRYRSVVSGEAFI